MLSRTAENLYWTGRYIERAENMARLLDVSHRISLQRDQGPGGEWQSVLAMLGHPAAFAEKFSGPTAEALTHWVGLDSDNPSSIFSSVRVARENARALRATISNEMWEAINTTWLAMREFNIAEVNRRGLRAFCDWVKERSHVFSGTAYSTALQDDALHYLRLGAYLERADNTARLLDTKYHLLKSAEAGLATEYYNWGAVLRAVSAFRAYHQIYHDVITPERVVNLLVFRREVPRSLRFCADQVVVILDQLSQGRDLECQRLAAELHARLRFARIEKVFEMGLHEYLMDVVDGLGLVADQLAKDFLMTV
jgi:uncharacterized alpha-E superfamily protein